MTYLSFDCYGTLVDFQMDRTLREVFGDRLRPEVTDQFCESAAAYRFDEVLGSYKPYREVLARATERTAARYDIEYRDEDGKRIFEAVLTYGPYPEVPPALQDLAERFSLVILSNAEKDQIARTVSRLEAPFHAVFSAEETQAYKPRLAAFEFMLDRLGCAPDEIIHVSASPQYDLRPARDVGIVHTVLVDRGAESAQPWLGYQHVGNLSELAQVIR